MFIVTNDGQGVYTRDSARELLAQSISPLDFESFMLLAFGDEIETAIDNAETKPHVQELEGIVDSYHSMGCEVMDLCDELLKSNKRISSRDFAKQILEVVEGYM